MNWREVPGTRTVLPVSASEAKEYLGLPEVYESSLLDTILAGAITAVERYSGLATTQCQIEVWYEETPSGPVAIPQPPLVSVDEAAIVDCASGTETPLAASDYTITTNGRVSLIQVAAAPSTPQRLRLRCTVGYPTAAAVPAELKLAILRTALRTWENRSSVVQPDLAPVMDTALWQTLIQH